MGLRKYQYQWKMIKVAESQMPTAKISSSQSAEDILRGIFSKLSAYQEHFVILGLDRGNKVIMQEVISSGGIHGTVVDIKIMAKFLIGSLCSGVILCHNHPSGSVTPSSNDDNITAQARDALKLLDIFTLDHLILGEHTYYSYADEGKI